MSLRHPVSILHVFIFIYWHEYSYSSCRVCLIVEKKKDEYINVHLAVGLLGHTLFLSFVCGKTQITLCTVFYFCPVVYY